MKKIFLILTTLIAIFGISNIYALNYDYSVGREIFFNNNHIQTSFSLASNTLQNRNTYNDFTFDNNITPTNANFIRFAYSGQLLSYINETNNINLSNINWSQTANSLQCLQGSWNTETNTQDGRIIYADGTSASIELSQRNYICDLYNSSQINASGIASGTYEDKQILIDNFNFQIYLKTNGTWQQCQMENGFIVCPVINNVSYTGLRFIYNQTNIDSGGLIKYSMQIWRSVYEINSSTQQIINNNNQNTQTIVNNITDTTLDPTTLSNTTNINNLGQTSTSNGALNLLMLPVNFISSIISSFGNSCASFDLGTLWGVNITLPCINLKGLLGQGLYNLIDIFMFFGIFFAFIKSVIKFIRKTILLTYDASSEVGLL